MSRARVFVCDDEMLIRLWLEEHLQEEGFEVHVFADGASVIAATRDHPPDILLLDLRLPDYSGLEVLAEVQALRPSLPVIMMTAYGEVETAVGAVRAGAYHFLEKPVNLSEILLLIEQAIEACKLRDEVERLRAGHEWRFSEVTLVGRSPAMRRIAERISRIGEMGSPSNILIRGESGTGKDVVARAIHARGPRRSQPFVDVNCTALPEHLVESELFGHEAGAFTGARQSKRGLLEVADGGTAFLDEIGDMPVPVQAKLLHFLESHSFRRVGGVRDIEVDVHVVAATNRDLTSAVERGDFREDLFYRLNVVPVDIPPLRKRPDDIGPLTTHFIGVLSREMRRPVSTVTADALAAMERYAWPGNVRQLRNVLERILIFEDTRVIDVKHLPSEIAEHGTDREGFAFVLPAGGVALEDVERELIEQALDRTQGNKSAAARLLGLTRDTLRYRLERFGLG
ncbi:MAG: sigma-54 dependent transcriptional regulator [Gemmatimonadetes bacterium]|nr:sigma-54 dependent transcriptional regulator [Gemmatimonadota bacterium]